MTKTHRKQQDLLLDENRSPDPEPFIDRAPTAAEPTDDEREAMASLAIGFEAGAFSFEGCRYVELADAVLDATLAWQRGHRR